MRWVCKLIFLLTRSSKDVTKIRIKMMIQAHKKQYSLPTTRTMLLLFKCLKPELILFEVSSRRIENAFPKYPPQFKDNLNQAGELSYKHLTSIWIKPGVINFLLLEKFEEFQSIKPNFFFRVIRM